MVQVEYVGPFDEVEFEIAPGVWSSAKRGVPVEVPDELAGTAPEGDDSPGRGLLAQPDAWRSAKAKPTKQPAPTGE